MNVQPGEYRFPYGSTAKEMTTPEFEAKMKQGPVGIMSIQPSGEMQMGKLMGQWFVYSLYHRGDRGVPDWAHARAGRIISGSLPRERHGDLLLLFRGALAELDWWGKGTRITLTSHDRRPGIFALLDRGGTFGWRRGPSKPRLFVHRLGKLLQTLGFVI